MAWNSLRTDMELSKIAIASDRKKGNAVGAFCVGEKALYLSENNYIPLDAVERFHIRDAQKGTFCVEVFYGNEEPVSLIFAQKRDAQMLSYLLMSSRPGIKWEE